MNWTKHVYRRFSVDIHVPDWNPALLSNFNAAQYVGCMARAGVQSLLQYTNSHVGLCLWRTRVGQRHASMGERDFFRKGDRENRDIAPSSSVFSSTTQVRKARRGDELYHYYVAYGHSHGEYVGFERLEGIGGIYLAVQRLDGFMSADAAYSGGWLVTPPVTFSGRRLELNIDCGATGSAVVELRDEHDVPIKGFRAEECDRIRGNHVHYTVTWKGRGDVSALVGKPVRLRLVMRNSRLFAFQFCDAM